MDCWKLEGTFFLQFWHSSRFSSSGSSQTTSHLARTSSGSSYNACYWHPLMHFEFSNMEVNDAGVSSALYQNLESTNTLFLGWFACEWTCNQGVPRFPANGVREPIERGHRGAGGQGAQDEKGREGSSPFLWTTATVVTPRVNFFPALWSTDQPTPTVIEAASRLAPWPRPARPKRVGLRNKELLHPGRGQEEAERRS